MRKNECQLEFSVWKLIRTLISIAFWGGIYYLLMRSFFREVFHEIALLFR